MPHDAERRYDAIYLYGVDVMSTGTLSHTHTDTHTDTHALACLCPEAFFCPRRFVWHRKVVDVLCVYMCVSICCVCVCACVICTCVCVMSQVTVSHTLVNTGLRL